MILKDHQCNFILGKNLRFPGPSFIFKAETVGVKEALSWLMIRQYTLVHIDTNSLMTVQEIQGKGDNRLEVGLVIRICRATLQSIPGVSLRFVRNQVNREARELARISCLVNCFNFFMSHPIQLLETFL